MTMGAVVVNVVASRLLHLCLVGLASRSGSTVGHWWMKVFRYIRIVAYKSVVSALALPLANKTPQPRKCFDRRVIYAPRVPHARWRRGEGGP